MKFLREDIKLEIKYDGIFKLCLEAMEKKSKGLDVSNGILGALYDENGDFIIHETVFDIFDKIPSSEKARYSSDVDGGEKYANAVKNWVFQNNEFLKKSTVVATPGGSGAVSSCISGFLNSGDAILIPDICWSSYELMAKIRGLDVIKFSCFSENKFTLENLKSEMIKLSKRQKNILIVINDPAHNPTGYTMSISEWEELIDFCNELAVENTVTILNDIAYIDYCNDFEKSREYMKVFEKINDNILVAFAFSGSKTLTSYGMRIGACLFYNNSTEIMKEIHDYFEKNARGNWSNCNNGAIQTVIEVFENNRERFKKDLMNVSKMLNDRTKIFIEEAKKVGLKHYLAKEGFFITLLDVQDKNSLICNKLKEENIYFFPLNKGIRIAISSLNKEQCKKLPKMIQRVIKEDFNVK